jgi:integrase
MSPLSLNGKEGVVGSSPTEGFPRVVGVLWMTPHVLRHLLATELLHHGYHTSAIANVLGHRSDALTRKTYVHWCPQALARAMVGFNHARNH